MKLKTLLSDLEAIKKEHGEEVECYLQDDKPVAHECFFIVPEEYSPADGGWAVNIRTWPY